MSTLVVRDPDFETRIRDSFRRQGLNDTIGASLARVAPGVVDITLPFASGVSQQHGFFHGGVIGAIGDNACGYAAMTLTDRGTEVLTIEYKVNFLSPAAGQSLVARGRVTRAGRTVTVCTGEVFSVTGGAEKLVATMLVTIMTVPAGGAAASPAIREDVAVEPAHRSSSAAPPVARARWCFCRGDRRPAVSTLSRS
jgi:uncharacterized protein (TIGR00369 family)